MSYDPNFCYGDDDEDGNDGMDIDAGNGMSQYLNFI